MARDLTMIALYVEGFLIAQPVGWPLAADPLLRGGGGGPIGMLARTSPTPHTTRVSAMPDKQTVVIADASPTFRALLRQEFDPARYEIHEAGDGEEAIRLAKALSPSLITLSVAMPKLDGLAACAAITAAKESETTTVVMITSSESPQDQLRAFEAGAMRFLDKQFERGELGAYATDILRMKETLHGAQVLVVDDSRFVRTTVSQLLQMEGAVVAEACHGKEALELMAAKNFDVVVTDYHMPEMDGLALVRNITKCSEYEGIPVLFVTAANDKRLAMRALDAGASDFIRKPFEGAELLARIRSFARLSHATKRLQELATTDELTGLFNRREAFYRLGRCFATAERYATPFSCIAIDVDHFKRFNDDHGHAAGDLVLSETARLLKENSRVSDDVFRVGGEEFLVLCAETNLDGASTCAEKLRAALEDYRFEFQGRPLKVTISAGVAEYGSDIPDADRILALADAALYESKRLGRNRVTRSDGASVAVTV